MSQAVPGLSAGFQAGSAMFGAMSEASADRASAAVNQENARLDLLQGALNSEDIRRRGRAVQGEAISALAAGGGDVSGMSAQDLIFQNSLEMEYASMNAKYSAGQAARGDLAKAAADKAAARSAIIGGVFRAGGALLMGAQQASDNSARYNAYFPGGQKLPMPTAYSAPPSYAPSGVVGPR